MIGCRQRGAAPFKVAPPPVSPAAKFPVIPVEQGIFAIVPENCHYGTKKWKANQALAGQFP